MAGSTERSVVSALMREHRHIEELLTRLRAAADPADRRALLDEVTTAMVQHTDAEEKYLYAVVREAIPRGAIDIETQVEAHARIMAVLGEMQRSDAGDEEFRRLTAELVAEVRQNILDEETSVFAWLTQWVDERTLAEIGDEIEALRS
jgi:hemerythrin-like domain-containing protein